MTTGVVDLQEQLRAADEAVDRIEFFIQSLVRPEVMAAVLDDRDVTLSVLQMLGFGRLYGLMRESGTLTTTREGKLLLSLLVPFAAMVDAIDDAMETRFGSVPGATA